MHYIYTKIIALFILVLSLTNANASTAEDLSQLLTNFQSMQADFKQTIYDQNQKPLQKSMGNMALKRPGQFRWETKQPTPQLLLTDGNYVWIYDIDLEQATKQKADTGNQNNPASLLSGSIKDIERRFEVSTIQKPGKIQWFRLVPKDDSDMFQWIELGFADGKLSSMKLNDKLGTLSVFDFSNVRINPTLNASLFTFKVPKGVEVIIN
ncbi:MAG: outer-rane lipoprotein carrier protein [Gammaproteobacteria bacterium]|jgi:outer membrane lipoprotein carrier protein|nr:outer-rane lipoprotein carrier protein [Gammaproteobacteria bacterium]